MKKEKYCFTKNELIKEVKKETEIGKKAIEVEMAYLKALTDGSLLKEILKNNDKETTPKN